jgi:uncharacterized membrane protein HdeD (DUF308 family)
MIVAGLLAIVVPPVAGIAVAILIGWLLVFSGVTHLVFAWHTRGAGSIIWEVFLGLLYLAVGSYTLSNPLVGLTSLTLVLAAYLIIESILEFVLAVRLRPVRGSSWLFADGLITLVVAFMIWRSWPASSAWAIGVLVGVSMLFSGISRLMLSLAARSLIGRTTPATAG